MYVCCMYAHVACTCVYVCPTMLHVRTRVMSQKGMPSQMLHVHTQQHVYTQWRVSKKKGPSEKACFEIEASQKNVTCILTNVFPKSDLSKRLRLKACVSPEINVCLKKMGV